MLKRLRILVRKLGQLIFRSLYWIANGFLIYFAWKWFRKEGCLPEENLVVCLRQWQGLIAGSVALFIASVTWKLTNASIFQSRHAMVYGHYEKVGDKLDNDLRDLEVFKSNFWHCHFAVDRHLNDENKKPSVADKERLKKLDFPSWPDVMWQHFFSTCLDEYKEHYDQAINLRKSRPDDYLEHGIRCQGIFKFFNEQLELVRKMRLESYQRELDRVKLK